MSLQRRRGWLRCLVDIERPGLEHLAITCLRPVVLGCRSLREDVSSWRETEQRLSSENCVQSEFISDHIIVCLLCSAVLGSAAAQVIAIVAARDNHRHAYGRPQDGPVSRSATSLFFRTFFFSPIIPASHSSKIQYGALQRTIVQYIMAQSPYDT